MPVFFISIKDYGAMLKFLNRALCASNGPVAALRKQRRMALPMGIEPILSEWESGVLTVRRWERLTQDILILYFLFYQGFFYLHKDFIFVCNLCKTQSCKKQDLSHFVSGHSAQRVGGNLSLYIESWTLLHSCENTRNQCVYIDEYCGYFANSTKNVENLCTFANVYFWLDISRFIALDKLFSWRLYKYVTSGTVATLFAYRQASIQNKISSSNFIVFTNCKLCFCNNSLE